MGVGLFCALGCLRIVVLAGVLFRNCCFGRWVYRAVDDIADWG